MLCDIWRCFVVFQTTSDKQYRKRSYEQNTIVFPTTDGGVIFLERQIYPQDGGLKENQTSNVICEGVVLWGIGLLI